MRFETLTCGAANPTPSVLYIVSAISSIKARIFLFTCSTGSATSFNMGCPAFTTSSTAIYSSYQIGSTSISRPSCVKIQELYI